MGVADVIFIGEETEAQSVCVLPKDTTIRGQPECVCFQLNLFLLYSKSLLWWRIVLECSNYLLYVCMF